MRAARGGGTAAAAPPIGALLRWFARAARPLPWRTRRTPYRVTVAEFVLQQTRVETAAPYFRRFVRRFPSWRALARAPRSEVLKAWEGLGYYARARRLHELARRLVRDHRGRLPADPERLRDFPGMGPYVAAAVASLAFGAPVPAVDGNVRRVVSRLLARDVTDDEGREILAGWMAGRPAGRFNEAMMELGALVCRRRKPACGVCPLRRGCRAFAAGDPVAWPSPRRRRRPPRILVGAAVTIDGRGRVLVARRRDGDMLGGLWEFPGGKVEPGESVTRCIRRELMEELGLEVEVGPEAARVRHDYSHFGIDLRAHWCRPLRGVPRPIGCAAVRWIRPADRGRLAFSRADLRVWEALERAPAAGQREGASPQQPRAARIASSTCPGEAPRGTAARRRSARPGSTSVPAVS